MTSAQPTVFDTGLPRILLSMKVARIGI